MNRAALLLFVAFLVAGALFADASSRVGRRRRELLHNVDVDLEYYADIDIDPENNAVDASSRRGGASEEGGRASGGSNKGSKSRGKSCRRKGSKSTKKSGEAKSKCKDATDCVDNWNDFKDEFEQALLNQTEHTIAFCPGAKVVVPEDENFEIDVDDGSTELTSLQFFCCGDECTLDGNGANDTSPTRNDPFIELDGSFSGEKVFELIIVGMAIENFDLGFNKDGSFINVNAANVYLELSNNKIAFNTADRDGGFLYDDNTDNENTITVVSQCNTYKNNTATSGDGGVFELAHAIFISEDDTFENNEADDHGGVLEMEDFLIASFKNARFINNKAEDGGAMFVEDSEVHLENCLFQSNRATSDGGAIWGEYAAVRAKRVDFLDNECRETDDDLCAGGAIFLDESFLYCKECVFDNNSGEDGAAVYGTVASHQLHYESSFKNNKGSAAVYNEGAQLVFLEKVTFKDNSGSVAGEENVVSNKAAINYLCDGVKETDIPTTAAAFREGNNFLCETFLRLLDF